MRTSFVFATLFLATGVSLVCGASPALPPVPEPPVDEKLPAPPPAEILAKITAPAAKPVLTTQQGFKIEIDRSQQVLRLDTPKKDIWVSPRVEGNQTVQVAVEGAPLQRKTQILAKLKKGRILYTTEEKGDWVAVAMLEGSETVSGWVLKKNLKPVAADNPPSKKLYADEDFASAAILIQKGKQFDDGLYAAVELALQNGAGSIQGKKDWVPKLAAKVDGAGKPLAQLYAAAKLGGNHEPPPAALARLVAGELQAFEADEKRSKPLGFYNWSKTLESVFRQDRMLQSPADAAQNRELVVAIGRVLASDKELRQSYERVMRVNERLTNKLTKPGYRKVLSELDAGKTPQFRPGEEVSFLPPSRSHESDLVMKLYGGSSIPPGFDLMNEVIARLKSGRLSFEPQEDSGWYDHQLWSLEPLVRFATAPETKYLETNDEYRKHLEELFKGTYALTRETHVKQLELAAPTSAAPFDGPPKNEREKVFIAPQVQVELLPTMFLRRAQSYRFVRLVLEETFGKDGVKQMHRQTLLGPVEMNLADEFDLQERLFSGAYVVACRNIGMADALPMELGAGQSTDEQAATFLRWVASLRSDPDLAIDARMMVPVFFDQERNQVKVWVMLGWELAPSTITFTRQPAVKITTADGKPPAADEAPEVIFTNTYRSLATPVFAEVYVSKLLNRAEFRRHCDTYQTQAAILANLE